MHAFGFLGLEEKLLYLGTISKKLFLAIIPIISIIIYNIIIYYMYNSYTYIYIYIYI